MMLTRLHVSIFIGFTILVWLIALWVQGMPVLSVDFIKPFSLVVGVSMIVITIFNKYLWSWKVFRSWFVKRPDLRGTWKVEITSNFVDVTTGKKIAPITGFVSIRQSLTDLTFRLLTKESRSYLIAHNFELTEEEIFKFTGVYRNEPKIELQKDSSKIHHGSFSLEVFGYAPELIEGHYWTDRNTSGSMSITERKKKLYDTYDLAKTAFGQS